MFTHTHTRINIVYIVVRLSVCVSMCARVHVCSYVLGAIFVFAHDAYIYVYLLNHRPGCIFALIEA